MRSIIKFVIAVGVIFGLMVTPLILGVREIDDGKYAQVSSWAKDDPDVAQEVEKTMKKFGAVDKWEFEKLKEIFEKNKAKKAKENFINDFGQKADLN